MVILRNLNTENEYKSRINKAIDYIEANLEKPLTLDELASVANFSKFHFHRIFLAHTGETPFQFILRLRLEKAASLLILNHNKSITEISSEVGFMDVSVFSRNFKNYFHISASLYRRANHEKSNLSQLESNRQQLGEGSFIYLCRNSNTLKWRTDMKQNKSLEVKELPTMTVAYVRHTGPYKGDDKLFEILWGKICAWAGARGLMQQPNLQFLTVYHDDPNITIEDKLRMSVCVTVPAETKVSGEIGKMEIEGGKYVVARFDIAANEFTDAWQWVYGQWFPSSGFQPGDGPCLEIYPEEPKDGRFIVDICVPVKPI